MQWAMSDTTSKGFREKFYLLFLTINCFELVHCPVQFSSRSNFSQTSVSQLPSHFSVINFTCFSIIHFLQISDLVNLHCSTLFSGGVLNIIIVAAASTSISEERGVQKRRYGLTQGRVDDYICNRTDKKNLLRKGLDFIFFQANIMMEVTSVIHNIDPSIDSFNIFVGKASFSSAV